MNDDLASDWFHQEAFRMMSGDYEQCPACSMGILNSVATESGPELWCDLCDACLVEDES